jgi:hypothetical protein
MITYILHVTVITTVCFLFYKLMLQKETFYRLNRWTLMTCLAVSFGLPLLPVPQSWSWRSKLDELAFAGRWGQADNTGANAQAAQTTPVIAKASPTSMQDRSFVENRVAMRQRAAAAGKGARAKRGGGASSYSNKEVADAAIVRADQDKKSADAASLRVDAVKKSADAASLMDDAVKKSADASLTNADLARRAADAAKASADLDKKAVDETQLLRMVTAGTPAGEGNAGTLARASSLPLARTRSQPFGYLSDASLFLLLKGLFYCYLLGVVLFGLSFLLQLAVLLYQSYARPVIKDGRFRIVEVSGNRAPCSFGNTIFINPERYDWETYNQILIHEKIHVSGRHTLDILLAEIALVIQWFNPFAWLYRREVENNLEFLTDANVLLHQEVERSAYQLSLLRVSAPHLPFSLTNNYNQSLLKRRIVMMNSKRSSLHTVWKYFFLIPLFTGLVCALNKPVTAFGAGAKYLSANGGARAGDNRDNRDNRLTGQGREAGLLKLPDFWLPGGSANADTTKHPVKSRKDSTDHNESWGVGSSSSDDNDEGAGYSLREKMYIDQAGQNASVSMEPLKIDVQLSDPVTIVQQPLKLQYKVLDVDSRIMVNLAQQDMLHKSINVNVDPVNFSYGYGGMKGSFISGDSDLRDGSWFATSSDDKINFELKAQDDDHSWSYGFNVDKAEINPFPGQGNVEFKLVREAGTLSFKGQFDGQEGFGHFRWAPDPGYYAALKQMGVEDMEDRRQFSYFTLNVKKEYVNMIMHNGYPHISQRDLISFAAMHIDQEFIAYWHGSGLVDSDEPRNLISLKALHIDRSYVDDLKAAGYDHLEMRDLQSLKAQHIDGAYIRSLGRGKGEDMIPVRDLVTYKALHIDSAYLDGLRKVGYVNLSRNEISSLYSMHVSPEYIKSLQDLGYKDLTVRDLSNLKAMHVTAEDIKGFRDIGLKDLDTRQLSSFRAMKITPEFVKGFQNIGYKDLDWRQLNTFKSMDITPEFIKGFTELGYDQLSANQLSSLKAMGITPEFVKAFKEVGFDHIPVNQLTSLKATGVNADYISKMRAKGFDSKDLSKYIRLKTDFN